MNKQEVIESLGGIPALAEKMDISVQAIYRWPDTLTPQILKNIRIRLKGNGYQKEAKRIFGQGEK